MTNQELKQMAEIAKENWLFDEDTDPHGEIAAGLDYILADGDFDEDMIEIHVKDVEDYDGLEEWARFLGQQLDLR